MPLGNDIVKWICTRLAGSISEKNKKLKGIHIMYRHSDGNTKIHQVQIDETESELYQDHIDDSDAKYEYDLIVIDEGHHVFRKDAGE